MVENEELVKKKKKKNDWLRLGLLTPGPWAPRLCSPPRQGTGRAARGQGGQE